jgi:SnoaL-like domain
MPLGRVWVLAMLWCGCSKPHEVSERAAPAASAKAPPRVVASAPAPSASNLAASVGAKQPIDLGCGKVTVVEAARQLMHDWNAALNAHDADKLEKLYAPQVSFYGRDFSRDRVLATKRTALAAAPGFKQQLSDIRIAPGDQSASVTFSKASGPAQPVRGRLDVTCADGAGYAISAESDAPSDALAQANEGCEAAMYAVAFSLPEVKKAMGSATDEAPFGGLSYPVEAKHYSVAIGYHHEDRFEAAFFLDWMNDAFTVNQGDVPVPPAGLARVKAACPR